MKFVSILLSVLVLSCAQQSKNDDDTRPRGAGPEDHPCQEPLLDSDFYNCGWCGNVCSFEYQDSCVDGWCSCGVNPSCSGGERCLFGQCIRAEERQECENNSQCTQRKECINNQCIEVCEFDDDCASGYFCISGDCTFVECVPEECDGIDNDCDGEIDSTNGFPLSSFCIDGNVDINNLRPPCQKGVQICSVGTWSECMNSIPPILEGGFLACDSIDNDCDGCVDGNLSPEGECISNPPLIFDIIYAIDMSSSMQEEIQAVIDATNSFSSAFSGNAAFQFGIVFVPGDDNLSPELYSDLVDFATFETRLRSIPINTLLGSEEPQWDTVYELATGELPVSWRDRSVRIIIIFTDETGQSYRIRRGLGNNLTEADMCNGLSHGEVLATVTVDTYYDDYDDCGIVFPLSINAVEMANNLNNIISDPCQ